MKKIILLLTIFALTMSAMAQKPKLAVYVTGDVAINNIVGNRLVDGLAHNGKYTAVERTASFLKALSAEHGYQRSGEVDDSQIAELGKQFGVQYVCVASIATVWGDEKYFAAHIIDVQTAEVVATGSSSGRLSSSSDLIGVLNKLSNSLLNALDYSKSVNAKKVAVYVTRTGNRDVDIIFGDQLVAGFAKSGKYLAIERTSRFLAELSKETSYQQSGAVDDEDLVRLGRQMGVQYVCVAITSKAYGDYFLTSRLIDVKSAEVVNSYNAEGKKLNSSQNVMTLATEIAEKLSGRTIEEEKQYQKELQEEKRRQAKESLIKLGYVDLGLPSGTMWKNKNEGFFTEAQVKKNYFEKGLPSFFDWDELLRTCTWEWTGDGFKVIGKNGNYITLPAEGSEMTFYDYNSVTKKGKWITFNMTENEYLEYWEYYFYEEAYHFDLFTKSKNTYYETTCFINDARDTGKASVRLVQKLN